MRVSAAWYVFRVRALHEKAVSSILAGQGFETFLPTHQVEVTWSDRTKQVQKILFPGYLFVRLPETELAAVLAVAGVIGVLDTNLRPVPLPDEIIENLRRVASSLLPITPADFVAGDQVTVRHGALKGVTGVILRRAGALRLIVSIPMLNRSLAVEVPADALRRAADRYGYSERISS